MILRMYNTRKSLFSLLLVAVTTFAPLTSSCKKEKIDPQTENFYYSYVKELDGYAVAYHYQGDNVKLEIPSSYEGKPVVGIQESAFFNYSVIESITIPDGIAFIGDKAFFGCENLKNLTLPDSVTFVGELCFNSCSNLDAIKLSNGITTLKKGSFQGCESLTSILLPSTIKTIEADVFRGCTQLTSLTLPNEIFSIGEFAFSGCENLAGINLPNSLSFVGEYAFNECKKLILTIDNNVNRERWDEKWNNNIDGSTIYEK